MLGFSDHAPHVFEEKYPLDYMILGQHFFDDEIGYRHVARPGSDEKLLQIYVERIISALNTGLFIYVAHPDAINFTENDFIIGVDAHAPNELTDDINFRRCVNLVETVGGKIINL